MSEYDDFDLDRSTAEAWDNFESRLSEVLSVMDDSSDLTIGSVATSTETVPFVRFHSISRDTVRAEAAGNDLLGAHYQLGATQMEQFLGAGWNAPGKGGPAIPDSGDARNFWVEVDQEDSDRLAHLAVVALRDIYGIQHPIFLAPDQLAEILQPRPEPLRNYSEFAPEDVVATIPVSGKHLDDLIEAELAEMFGHQPMRDAEGDIAIRIGSTMLFLRTSSDHREIIVFACLVHDVDGRSRAMEVLSDLNSTARVVKFQLIRDRVFVTTSVFAHPFVPAHLRQAVRILSEVADGIDEELAVKLRGRTTFEQ